MRQETCWSPCIGSGFCFLQCYLQLGGLCCLRSKSRYNWSGLSSQHRIPNAPRWSMPEVDDCNLMVYKFATEERVRYCAHCKAYVREFDHHCPAFGNCIGQKNLVLFLMLLIGFLCTEASYAACSLHYSVKLQTLDKNGHVSGLSSYLAISTMLFSLLQLPWQGVFLAWHIYCVCFNIKTDEWMNWKKYPEFHLIVYSEPGTIGGESNIRFRNPYDKGLMQNLRELLIMPHR